MGYVLIPAPSSKADDEKREFNHVVEIYKCLKLPILQIIHKKMTYKQSDHSFKERAKIADVLEIDKNVSLYGKKILIVDDVFTSGSTVKAMIDLVKTKRPKAIKVLVLSKTQHEENPII